MKYRYDYSLHLYAHLYLCMSLLITDIDFINWYADQKPSRQKIDEIMKLFYHYISHPYLWKGSQ